VWGDVVRAFAVDGAACIRGLLNADEVAVLRDGIDASLAAPSPRPKVASRADDPGLSLDARVRRWFASRAMADAAILHGSSGEVVT
jgi:hypothetical protein